MRGHLDPQASMFSYFSPEARVPAAHPLRSIKGYADTALKSLSGDFDELYATTGRPSIAPERLLKASLLIALYSVRSDRLFCEMLDYNILFRWFLDMNLEEHGLDQSNFSRLRERLVESEVAGRFFDAVVGEARKLNLLSDEHFTVDGTLIEAWASTAKSMRRKDRPPDAGGPDDQGMVNIRGERRSNATHASASDPDAKLMRKSKGKESKLSYGGHALMENRHGLCVDLKVTSAVATEAEAGQGTAGTAAAQAGAAAHLGCRQGLSQQGFRGASAPAPDRPAHRDDQRAQDLWLGSAYHAPRRLRRESTQAQAGRRDLRLDESLRRAAPYLGAGP